MKKLILVLEAVLLSLAIVLYVSIILILSEALTFFNKLLGLVLLGE